MKHVFARRPVAEFEDYSTSHIGAGQRYRNRFADHPGRSLMWELEQSVLREFLTELNPRRVLDFACGTGRISNFVESVCPQATIEGIDISESMLTLARERAARTTYRLMSSSNAISFYGNGHFDLVMAFRFFANAEHSLRLRIGHDLGQLVSDNGALVINNHRNFWSTSYLARRLLGQAPIGALNADIERVFTDQGLHVVKKLSLGLWPQGDAKAMLLPWKAVRLVEEKNRAWLAGFHTLGFNTLWVLSKTGPTFAT